MFKPYPRFFNLKSHCTSVRFLILSMAARPRECTTAQTLLCFVNADIAIFHLCDFSYSSRSCGFEFKFVVLFWLSITARESSLHCYLIHRLGAEEMDTQIQNLTGIRTLLANGDSINYTTCRQKKTSKPIAPRRQALTK